MTACQETLMDATNQRMTSLETSMHRIERKFDDSSSATGQRLDNIAESLRILARLEERHEHVNHRLTEGAKSMSELREQAADLARRTASLESDFRQMGELRSDIRKLNWLVVSAVIVALLASVLVKGAS